MHKYAPEADDYVEWLMFGFTLTLGAMIGQLSMTYEDLVSIFATSCMGTYALLQIFCSFGPSSPEPSSRLGLCSAHT